MGVPEFRKMSSPIVRLEEKAQWSTALALRAEEQSLVPNISIRQFMIAWNFRGQDVLFWTLRHLYS